MSTTMSPRCTAALATLAALCLTACASTARQEESVSGRSARATLASQIAHPEAVRNGDPVYGIDGAAALQAQQKYEKSFTKESPDGNAPLVNRR